MLALALQMVEALLTKNADRPGGNRPGDPLTACFGVAHSTADPEATARAVRDYFDTIRTGGESSAHTVTDWNGSVVCIPWAPGNAEVAWHAGRSANRLAIGHELCETADPARFAASYDYYCALWARTCAVYGWSAGAIWGHWAVSAHWPAETDHRDPAAYLESHGVQWWAFLQAIDGRMRGPDLGPAVDILRGSATVATGRLGTDNRSWAHVTDLAAVYGERALPVYGHGGLIGVKLTKTD